MGFNSGFKGLTNTKLIYRKYFSFIALSGTWHRLKWFLYVQVRDLPTLKSVRLWYEASASITSRLCNDLHSASDVNYVLMEL